MAVILSIVAELLSRPVWRSKSRGLCLEEFSTSLLL